MKIWYYISIVNLILVVTINVTSLFLTDMSMFTSYLPIFFITTLGFVLYGNHLQSKRKQVNNNSVYDIPTYFPIVLGVLVIYIVVVVVFSLVNSEMGQMYEQDGVYKFKKVNEIRTISKEEYHLKLTRFISFFSAVCIAFAAIGAYNFYRLSRSN